MIPTIGADAFVSVIKFAAIIFALIHLGVAIALLRQIISMNAKINTHSGGCLRTFSLLHIILLSGIILLIVFI